MQYDAIIVGGSFAGLSVARQLQGNVLLVTKHPLGSSQTSACCTYLPVLEQLGCEEAILQTFRTVVVHFPNRTIAFRPRTPLCTFDYSIFCQSLARRLTADVVVATAQAHHHDVLLTTAGQFKTSCLIDCSGWGAALARRRQPNFVRHDRLSFGLETEVPSSDEAMHFYFDREIINKGVAWVFPCGTYSRVGVGSYEGDTHIKSSL
ncbi:MAG: NAD(P)/FAD-dependent oxidoreductase, partial [Candidatus Tectimicrobiota bacterium]